jgi:hypothetical protein
VNATLEALLASRVHADGRALRRTTLCHTHLAEDPLAVVVWRLGGERFRASAIAWGSVGGDYQIAVAGEPRNRDLYFGALLPFAEALCERVAASTGAYEERASPRSERVDRIPTGAQQLVVANRTTVEALALIGRYLGYLSDRSGVVPDPRLLEAGRHLRFYTRRTRVVGQSLLVPLDRFVAQHWATLLSPVEQANLASLDAQIEPHPGMHAFESSASAEATMVVGPEPTEELDRIAMTLLQDFNAARGRSTDIAVVEPLTAPIKAHYRALVDRDWDLIARVVERERGLTEAPSVARRWEDDRRALGRHLEWVVTRGGRYRTLDTPQQAAMTLRSLEEAKRRYEAECAIDDPALMIGSLLDGDALRGQVVEVDDSHTITNPSGRNVRRARLRLRSDDPVVAPEGKRLWWTSTAHDDPWAVIDVHQERTAFVVELQLTAATRANRLPAVGERITMSIHHTGRDAWPMPLPSDPPWTHMPAGAAPIIDAIDAGDTESETAPVLSDAVPNPETLS